MPDFSPPAIAHAIEANLFAQLATLKQVAAVDVIDEPDRKGFFSRLPSVMLNNVMLFQPLSEAITAEIQTSLTTWHMEHTPLSWSIGPSTHPTMLDPHLQANGFRRTMNLPGMAVDLHQHRERHTPLPGLTIERVREAEGLRHWLQPFTAGFRFPDLVTDFYYQWFTAVGFDDDAPWHHYLAWQKGQPVACASCLFSGDVAGIWNVATIPARQKQGIGTAMTVTLLQVARTRGHRLAVLLSSRAGYDMYRHLGFQVYHIFRTYIRTPTPGSSAAPGQR